MMSFKPIPIEIMQLDKKKAFELYIRIGDRFVLFAGYDIAFTEEHKARLLASGLKRLYVKDTDEESLTLYTAKHMDKILSDPHVAPKTKAKIFYSSSTYTMEEVFKDPRTETISEMKNTINSMVKLLLEDQDVMKNLLVLTEHDYYTYTHSINVGIFATALAIKLFEKDMGEHNMYNLGAGFFLHDIGKSKIPSEILNKPGALTEKEWDIMKKHPAWGYEILMETGDMTEEAAHIVLEHHERTDGSGYPSGKAGDEIHIYARICAIADAYDALTTKRCYKSAKRPFDALKVMQKEMAQEFDPEFFATFVMLFAPPEYSATHMPGSSASLV